MTDGKKQRFRGFVNINGRPAAVYTHDGADCPGCGELVAAKELEEHDGRCKACAEKIETMRNILRGPCDD